MPAKEQNFISRNVQAFTKLVEAINEIGDLQEERQVLDMDSRVGAGDFAGDNDHLTGPVILAALDTYDDLAVWLDASGRLANFYRMLR